MKVEQIEWGQIGRPLTLFIIALLVSVGFISFSNDLLVDAESYYQRERNLLRRVARDYAATRDDRALYQQHVERFATLQQRGVIGEEHRLAWIELLKVLNRDLKLPVLRYDIEPRKSLPITDADVARDNLRVHETSMMLTLGVLHEGDLFTLERALREQAHGLFEIRGCEIKRADRVIIEANTANLQAICKLSWYTVEIVPKEVG
jgi:hypothetical protein